MSKICGYGKKKRIKCNFIILPTTVLITPSSTPAPLLVEDPPRVVLTRNEFNQETVVLEGIYVHYHYEGNN
jgi:hypothetical protein